MIRMILFNYHLQGFLEVTLQCAADTAAVDLGHFDAGFLQETAVNADLTEFIFYQDNILARKYIFDQLLDQGRLAGPQKT